MPFMFLTQVLTLHCLKLRSMLRRKIVIAHPTFKVIVFKRNIRLSILTYCPVFHILFLCFHVRAKHTDAHKRIIVGCGSSGIFLAISVLNT